MAKKRTIRDCVSEIRRLNKLFIGLKKKDGPYGDRLRHRKDELMDEMAGLCDHPVVLATEGGDAPGLQKIARRPRRICTVCGYCEFWDTVGPDQGSLAGRPTRICPFDEYLLAEGEVVRRLGINI